MNWWRAHHGMPFDSKLEVVARRAGAKRGDVAAVWVAVLDYASQQEDRGSIDGLDAEVIAVGFDYELEYVARIISVFIDKELISENRVENWDKRQVLREREDSSTDRVRKLREKRHETPRNASGTPCNATETPRNTQNRTEQIREEQNIQPPKSPLSGGALAEDDNFPAFRAAAEAAGMQASEPDWREAQEFVWRRLDFEQRIAAIAGMKQPRSPNDPAIKALPKNYLARQMWNRRPWEERKGRSLVEEMAHL